MSEESIADWVKANMTVNETSILETYKEDIARLIGITEDGRIILLKDKSILDAKQMITLYLIGRHMAWLAGYSKSHVARNTEIATSLGIPTGTVGRCLRELEEAGYAFKGKEGGYTLVLSSLATFFAGMEGTK